MDISELLTELNNAKTYSEKLKVLDKELKTSSLLAGMPQLSKLSPLEKYVLKAMALTGGESTFQKNPLSSDHEKLKTFLDKLIELESFYSNIGGIVGYWAKMKELMGAHKRTIEGTVHLPNFIDISFESEEVLKMIYSGIKNLPLMCELYPIGGAADRLHLKDEKTNQELPAAKFFFNGTTLLHSLIQDLEAREYLYFKIFGKKVTIPIAFMTSDEKGNHDHILSIFDENNWFNRPKESIRFFKQPSIPTMTEKGEWYFKGNFDFFLKPGGHGVLWKLAEDQGIFKWLTSLGRKKALVRQINNPVAGIDYGLLAFMGRGCMKNADFGFASCPREINAAEGINVLIEKPVKGGFEYRLSNIEYCDLKSYDLSSRDCLKFTSNTNILFADLEQTRKAATREPFPGALVNFKQVTNPTRGLAPKGKVARLETTMQNISDQFVEKRRFQKREMRNSFITFNRRLKTISTTKRVYQGKTPLETPEKCFYDFLLNRKELLEICDIKTPHLPSFEDYLENGPSFLFNYHPSLGPLYSIICQKLRFGRVENSSELILQIAEVDIENIYLNGSLLIFADSVSGHIEEGLRNYSERVGRCELKNVKVINEGIKKDSKNNFWKGKYEREESLKIQLEANAEFSAEDVTFRGSYTFKVPENTRLTVFEEGSEIKTREEKIEKASWHWKYKADAKKAVLIKKKI